MRFANPLKYVINGTFIYGRNPDLELSELLVHPYTDIKTCVSIEYFPEILLGVIFEGEKLEYEYQAIDKFELGLELPDIYTNNESTHSDVPDTDTALESASLDSHNTFIESICTENSDWSEIRRYSPGDKNAHLDPKITPEVGNFEDQWEIYIEAHNARLERESEETERENALKMSSLKSWIAEQQYNNHHDTWELPDELDLFQDVFFDALEPQTEALKPSIESNQPKIPGKIQYVSKAAFKWFRVLILAWLLCRGIQKEVEIWGTNRVISVIEEVEKVVQEPFQIIPEVVLHGYEDRGIITRWWMERKHRLTMEHRKEAQAVLDKFLAQGGTLHE